MLVPLNNFEPVLAHRLRISVVMKKQNFMAAVFFCSYVLAPMRFSSIQSKHTHNAFENGRFHARSFESAIAEAAQAECRSADPLTIHNETRFRPWLTSPVCRG